nr:BAH and coiled-coil domain-containing protein 1-like [Paramormyrops kingsleyae]
MEGRDFGPPPHLLSERGALVHRAASRIASTGHASVQHRGHFQTGKYYSSHLPMAPHSGGGLMGNSSASFMGTFLTSSLSSPASHSSGPPTSPSSPSFRGGTHSNASQIWFPHSHDAPGYARFSGSLAHTFLPMSHLDHHGNSSVLYGQHPFYDAQKENFYLRGLPSQQPLISANHSLSSVTRTTSGQPLRSCSREHKSLKEATAERLSVGGTKDKERGGGKQEAKDRERHKQQQPQPNGHSLEEETALVRHKAVLAGECREPLESRAKQLSACLLSSKTPGGEPPLGRHPGAAGATRCSKEAISREMRISEPPADCLQRAPVLQHSVPYPMPPSVGSAANPGGFHCLPLHPSHSHHPPHPPYHSEFYSPPPPAPLANPIVQEKALQPKLTGPTFVPSVGHQDNRAGRPFQLGNPDCRRAGDAGGIKDKVVEKGGGEGAGGGSEGAGSWPRRPHWQQQVYPKADKAPAWPHPHLQQQPHLAPSGHLGPRPRSSDCLGGTDMDSFRASLPQGALGASPFRDCSHMGPSPGVQSGEAKGVASRSEGVGGGCALQRDGQKVARICHQQQARSAQEAAAPEPGRDGKQKLEMVALGYVGGQQQPVPPWAVRAHHMQAEEERRKAYLESLASIRASRTLGQQPQQQLGGIGPSASPRGPQGEVSAIRSLLKYSSQHQPHLLPQRTPFGGLGCLKSGTVGAGCPPQGSKQTLPSKKGLAPNGDRVDCGDGRGREARDTSHREGEVRQPPVGIAVAVARHSEPPCHPLDGPSGHNRHGRAMPATKDGPRTGCSLEPDVEEGRKRMCDEQLSQPCMEREQELLIRDNKKRVEFASIHPSSSCHGDLTSHIMVPGGTSLQSSQIGTDPSAHHPSHHHWMPQTGSPSLWMAGHSYGIGHSALHQGLPPGFSTPLPSTLQPVLPLTQDTSTPLVVLPGEPAVHPSAHHLDVIEQPGLWPPVYSACGAPSHIQHTAVYSRSQFLRQQELYALQQQQQQQQQRAAHAMELQHRSNHVQMQKKAEDAPEGLDMLVPEPPRPPKPFSVVPSHRKTGSSGSCTARLSPCCRSPSLRSPNTKGTPCPAPSPAAAAPHSPALSPALLRMPKQAERQDMRVEGQPPQDYPQSLEPEEDEEEGSYDSEDADDVLHPRDGSASLVVTGPSPSSIVKLEANQKAKNKKERQGLSGSLSLSCVEGQVKVKKKVPSRPMPLARPRKPAEDKEEGRPRRVRGPSPRHQQAMWGMRGDRRSPAVISERLKRATRKSVTQQVPTRKSKGRAVSRLLESFAANEGFQMDEDSSFSDGGEDGSQPGHMCHVTRSTPALPSCILTKELLMDGLKVLISEDELLYAARIHTLELTDIYSITIDGERRSRQKIYSLEQLLQEAVLDVQPGSEALLTSGQRVCAYWSERSRCLYPGYVSRGGTYEDGKAGGVMVEFDDGDRGRISLPNIRLLPPDYQIHSPASVEPPTLVACAGQRGRRSSTLEKAPLSHMTSEKPSKMVNVKECKAITKAKPGRPKGSTTKNSLVTRMNKTANPMLSWPVDLVPKKKAINNLFQVNGSPRKPFKRKEVEAFSLSSPTVAPAKGIFRSSFAVDSFSSIANGYSSFGNQPSVMSVSSRSSLCGRGRRPGEGGGMQGRKAEFLVKLDHEGVTSPKTKNSKALLLRGSTGHGSQLDKGFDTKGVAAMAQTIGYSHPALLIKDNNKADGTRADLLLKGVSHLQKPTPSLVLADYADFGMNCHSDCPSSYSDMDEEEDDDDERGAPMATASGGLRTAGSFLSRLSVSSSSGSSSSSSSGSLSSSSLCSSDNDSSYSSEDEEGSALLLQGCLSSHRPLLQPPEPASGPTQGSFVAKTMTVPGTKAENDNSASSKPLKRKQCPGSAPKSPKDLAKRQKFQAVNNQPKVSAFLPARQLWKWSGNPTQRRGMKGKARKLFYKAVVRGRETVCIGDCAVFLSAGRPHLPYVGRIESFWESWSSSMVVKVKWFYHPEETKLGKQQRDGKHALYQSSHEDENDVQTISHKCQVVSREEYEQLSRIRKPIGNSQELYYLAGTYDPANGQLFTAEGLPILC